LLSIVKKIESCILVAYDINHPSKTITMEENKEGTNEKLNHSLIKQAGKSIKNAAVLITISVVLNVLFPIVVSNIEFSRHAFISNAVEAGYVMMGLNLILGIAVIYKFYKAGNSLMNSVSNDMG